VPTNSSGSLGVLNDGLSITGVAIVTVLLAVGALSFWFGR
jgi:hypothetical protein